MPFNILASFKNMHTKRIFNWPSSICFTKENLTLPTVTVSLKDKTTKFCAKSALHNASTPDFDILLE